MARTAARILRVRSVGIGQCYEAHMNSSQRPAPSIRIAQAADAERLPAVFYHRGGRPGARGGGGRGELSTRGGGRGVPPSKPPGGSPGDAARWIASDLVLVAAR